MLWGIQITGNLNDLEVGKRYNCVPEGEYEKLQERIKELEVEVIKHRKGRLDALELISHYDQKWGKEKLLLEERIKELGIENERLNKIVAEGGNSGNVRNRIY